MTEVFYLIGLVLIGLGLLIFKIKSKGIRQVTISLIVAAENAFKKGENRAKMNFVIDSLIERFVPEKLQFFINRDTIEKMVQRIFDEIKEALDN